ncbi:MAG: hypothetical protein H7Y59_15290 [Anaerolineales bacterium]|nr:hypothetical protein [Anaerolineales bacterium]
MHKGNIFSMLGGLLFIFIALACSSPDALPSATPVHSQTSTAPSVFHTLSPTYTATATAVPTSVLVNNQGHVVRSEHFDDLSTLSLAMDTIAEDYSIIDGRLVLIAEISPQNMSPWEDGDSAGRTIFSPGVGNVSVFLFRVEENTYFGFHFEIYETTANSFQYKGINLQRLDNKLKLFFRVGEDGTTRDIITYPVDDFQFGTWFYYSLQVLPDGLVTARLWERDQPAKMIFDQTVQLDTNWAKPGFTFVVTSVQGKMEVDEYQEIELTDAK